MKTGKKPRNPRKDKLATINLGRMNCGQLVEWLETESTKPENEKCKRLREYYRHGKRLELLRLCGPLNAKHHVQHCMTARHLASVPTIEMKVAGGKPDEKKMPPFTAALKRIAAINGQVLHRWGKGAFFLYHPLKEAPPALETES